MNFIQQVATALGWTEDKLVHVVAETLKSFYVTFGAMLLGLSVDAYANGWTDNLGMYFTFLSASRTRLVITNIAAPAYRTYDASKKVSNV